MDISRQREETAVNTFSPHPLLEYCKNPLECENQRELFSCCQNAAKSLLKEETAQYNALKISVFEGIFFCGKSVAELTAKKYPSCRSDRRQAEQLNCCLFTDLLIEGKPLFFFPIVFDKGYKLLSPHIIRAEADNTAAESPVLSKKLKKLNKIAQSGRTYPIFLHMAEARRPYMEIKTASAIIDIALKDLAFVTRFNAETFFKDTDISVFGRSALSLSEKQDAAAFTALYAIAFCGLTFEDIYRVDQVFSFSDTGIRSKDMQKRQASEALLKQLKENSFTASSLQKMAEALMSLKLPPLNVTNPIFMAENYVNYWGTAAMGAAFLKPAANNKELLGQDDLFAEAAKKAEIMADYRYAVSLCQEIPTVGKGSRFRIKAAPSFKAAEKLQQTAEEKENAHI